MMTELCFYQSQADEYQQPKFQKYTLTKRSLLGYLALMLTSVVFITAATLSTHATANPLPTANEEQPPTDTNDNNNTGTNDLGLSELVNTQAISDGWEDTVQGFLEKYDLSTSFVGQTIGTFILALIFLIVFYIVKKFAYKTIHKLKDADYTTYIPYKRVKFYLSLLNTLSFLLLFFLFTMVICGIWSEDVQNNFIYNKTNTFFQFIATFTFLFILGSVVFEAASTIAERFFARWASSESARIQTLLPIARNIINVALFIVLGITLISELGINIMPLLAGAGVIGFAVGFGAQTIIKDLITGFIIIFEDLVQVGDVVTVGGKSGIIEKITIRKIQLRSLEGIVFTVPYSEISIVENMTKEYSYYLFNVGIAYRESPDEVIEILKDISEEMQNDADYKDFILEPIEILGVDAFASSSIVIKARIKTAPIKQWMIGREFNRRMKYRFDENNIEIPFPHQTIYFGEDKKGNAPAANIKVKQTQAANEEFSSEQNSKKNMQSKSLNVGIKDDNDNED